MKKFLSVLFCILMVSVMVLSAGCAKKEEAPAETQAQSETTAKETEAAENTSEPAEPEDYGTIELSEYKGLTKLVQDVTVSDREVDIEIQARQDEDTDYTEVDRPAKHGDTVNIDYEGKIDGEPFEGGTDKGYDLELGSLSFIDGFEDGIIGMKAGETKDLNLAFPDDYWVTDLAGKPTVFTVTVNAVKETKHPELNDEWVKRNSDGAANTVEEYKAWIRKELENTAAANAKLSSEQDLINQIMSNSTFNLNQEAVDYQYDRLWETYTQYAEMNQMSIEEYFQAYGVDVDAAKDELKVYAENICKDRLITDTIFEKENMSITPSDEETVAKDYNLDPETLKSLYGEDNFIQTCKQYRVYQFIFDNAVEEK